MRTRSSDAEVRVDVAAGIADRHRPPGRITAEGLVPQRDRIGPRRDPVDPVAPLVIGDGEVPVGEYQDERAHVRMDVAEHADHSRPIEPDSLRLARGIAPEVELLGLRKREHVVIRAVAVREVDPRARGDREHVRYESLVSLIEARAALLAWLEGRTRRAFEIDDAAAAILGVARTAHAEGGGIRSCVANRAFGADVDAAVDCARCAGGGPAWRQGDDEKNESGEEAHQNE